MLHAGEQRELTVSYDFHDLYERLRASVHSQQIMFLRHWRLLLQVNHEVSEKIHNLIYFFLNSGSSSLGVLYMDHDVVLSLISLVVGIHPLLLLGKQTTWSTLFPPSHIYTRNIREDWEKLRQPFIRHSRESR